MSHIGHVRNPVTRAPEPVAQPTTDPCEDLTPAAAAQALGDAARVSVQSQSIGVLAGSTVFAIGVYPQDADGQPAPVAKEQLMAAAHAVLDGR